MAPRRGTQKWGVERRQRTRRFFRRRYGDVCMICVRAGRRGASYLDYSLPDTDPMSYSVDHIVPVGEGGTNKLSNLQPAHRRCNEERAGHYRKDAP